MNRSLTLALVPLWLAAAAHAANTAPTVVIQSAAMRGATGLMDVVFRVNDPDDATVKTRALAFIDGQRSFAKLVKPTTFADGTGSKIGDAIATNTNHTLTWNVASDWNIDLGQIKFEILAMDGRGLLPLDWVTIPAANGQPEVTISKNAPSDQEVLDALFWQYASGDPGLTLENGVLMGTKASGVFSGESLIIGSEFDYWSRPYIFNTQLNSASTLDMMNLARAARALEPSTSEFHVSPIQSTPDIIKAWGSGGADVTESPRDGRFKAISAGPSHSLALKVDGTVVAWGIGQAVTAIPPGLAGIKAIACGYGHSLALKSDGTVAAWGLEVSGETRVPSGLSGVTAIAACSHGSVALKADGTVVSWGSSIANSPDVLSGVIAIAANNSYCLALKNNGTLVGWSNWDMLPAIPQGLSGVTAIAAGLTHSLALKNDGTVVAWGSNEYGESTVPTGLSGVKALSAGDNYSMALRTDGTVVAWGNSNHVSFETVSHLSSVSSISATYRHCLALKKSP